MISTKIASKDKLAATEIKTISDLIKKKTKKTVVVTTEEDKDLLGGAVIKYDDKIIDMSLRQKINSLQKQLAS